MDSISCFKTGESVYDRYFRATRTARVGGKLVWILESEWNASSSLLPGSNLSNLSLRIDSCDGKEYTMATGFVFLGIEPRLRGHRVFLEQSLDGDASLVRRNRYHKLTSDIAAILPDPYKPLFCGDARSIVESYYQSLECIVQFGITDTQLIAQWIDAINRHTGNRLFIVGGVNRWMIVGMPDKIVNFSGRWPNGLRRVSVTPSFAGECPYLHKISCDFFEEANTLSLSEVVNRLSNGELDVDEFAHSFVKIDNNICYVIGRSECFQPGPQPYRIIWHISSERPRHAFIPSETQPHFVTATVKRSPSSNRLLECKLDGFEENFDTASVARTSIDCGEQGSAGFQWPPSVENKVQLYVDWRGLKFPEFVHALPQQLDSEHRFLMSVPSGQEVASKSGERVARLNGRGHSIE